LLALRSYSNRGSAAWTGPAATPMNRMALPGDRRHEVGTHQIASGQVKAAKPLVIEFRKRHPGAQFERPERFTLIDVADAGADSLFEQQLSKGGCVRPAGALDHGIQIEWIDQDIRAKMGDGCPGITNQFHHWRSEANRHDIIETEQGGGSPFRQAPALTWPIEVPRAGHPHVRVQRDPALEPHQQMLAVWLDSFHASTLESCDGRRAGVTDHLALDAPPQRGSGPPDRVAFRQGWAGARARAPRPSALCRTPLHAAALRGETP